MYPSHVCTVAALPWEVEKALINSNLYKTAALVFITACKTVNVLHGHYMS